MRGGPWFSYTVSGGGDYDGDGVPDVLSAGSGLGYYAWTTWVWTGEDNIAGLADWHNVGPSWSGHSVAALGDVDGDGCDDFASGLGLAPGWDTTLNPADYAWGFDVYYGAACP